MANSKKQLEIPGAEVESIAELDEVAGPYTAALYDRQELQVRENQLREQLADRMLELQVERYVYSDGDARYTITREASTRLKCKRTRGDGDGDE
jgi:hypothetical protein